MSTPIRRMRSGCCARAASGHTATAPPSSVMNWRRLRSSMGSPEPAVPAYPRLRMPRKRPQVLGVGLNRSDCEIVHIVVLDGPEGMFDFGRILPRLDLMSAYNPLTATALAPTDARFQD
jgi:hypothetical protein